MTQAKKPSHEEQTVLQVPLTLKSIAIMVGSLSAAFGIASTIHSQFVLPGLLHTVERRARELDQEAIVQHAQQPHKDAMNRAEIERIVSMLTSRLERIENKVDRIAATK